MLTKATTKTKPALKAGDYVLVNSSLNGHIFSKPKLVEFITSDGNPMVKKLGDLERIPWAAVLAFGDLKSCEAAHDAALALTRKHLAESRKVEIRQGKEILFLLSLLMPTVYPG